MTEREQFESAIREAFQIGRASANEHIAFSSTAFGLEALIERTIRQARAASPKVPQGAEDAYHALQNELIQIQATINSFATPAAALSALIDWHVAVATDPRVNGGMAIVPVETLKNAERYAWLKAHIIEQPTARSLMIESSEHKTEYVFPKLISWADFCGPITLDEAIDFKLAAAKENGE